MKIDDALKVNPGLAAGNTESKAAKSGETAKTTQHTTSEKVTLSARSSELHALESSVVATDAFDAGKVEAIKHAILNGQFKIDPARVADGLIDTVKDLLSTKTE